MRTIRFRGKRIDNKEWVYGYLYKLPLPSGEACMILAQDNNHLDNSLEPKYHLAFTLWVDLFIVDPATVGQFTGLHDRNGKEIYEGDIVRHDENGKCYSIIYEEPMFRFAPNDDCFAFLNHPELLEVVGNIHDNPEMIEKGGQDENN